MVSPDSFEALGRVLGVLILAVLAVLVVSAAIMVTVLMWGVILE